VAAYHVADSAHHGATMASTSHDCQVCALMRMVDFRPLYRQTRSPVYNQSSTKK
jgi:hypothetical protein